MRPMADEQADELRMSLGDHLDELRRRLIVGLIGPVVAAIVAFIYGRQLVAILCQPLLFELARRGEEPTLYNSNPGTAFAIYMKVSLITGLVFGIPWLVYQLWKFIAPGLYRHERRFGLLLMPGSALLTALGVLFMYFVMLPVTLLFLLEFGAGFHLPSLQPSPVQQRLSREAPQQLTPAQIEATAEPTDADLPRWPVLDADPADPRDGQVWINRTQRALKFVADSEVLSVDASKPRTSLLRNDLFRIDEYLSFVLWLALAFAIAFQLPLVMLLLGWTGIVTRSQMASWRKYAMLAFFVFAAVLTPPDPISQVAMALPMYVLYEFGLLLVRLTVKPEREW